MLKIYGTKTSSNVQKVLWCCGELGLAFERIEIGPAFGGNRTPGYLALNPNGLMPTIDDDGFLLWESNVIVRFLAAKHATARFVPPTSRGAPIASGGWIGSRRRSCRTWASRSAPC